MRTQSAGHRNFRIAALAALTPVLAFSGVALTAGIAHAATGALPAKPATGTITGVIFNDYNHNGLKDQYEGALSGVTVKLLTGDVDDAVGLKARTTTDENGRYTFAGLTPTKPGIWGYVVAAQAPVGRVFTTVSGGLAPYDARKDIGKPKLSSFFPRGAVIGTTAHAKDVAAGRTVLVNGGLPLLERPGAIAGRIFNDANHNGRQDKGEAGIKGAQVCLLKLALDGKNTIELRARATTDGTGHYTFSRLESSDHARWTWEVAAAAPTSEWSFATVHEGLEPFRPAGDAGTAKVRTFFAKGAVLGTTLHGIGVWDGKTTVVNGGLVKTSAPGESLPVTGPNTPYIAAGGGATLAAGLGMLVFTRRRKTVTA
jgi:LPXTG-motif cell wall-anchored protein